MSKLNGLAGAIRKEEQAAKVTVTGIGFAMVGEIEIAVPIKDQIVRPFQGVAFNRVEHALNLAGR